MQRYRGELFDLWPEWELGEKRRAEVTRRLEVYQGAYKKRVQRMIRERVNDGKSASEIVKCVTTAHNLAGTVADAIAVAYQRGCGRELRVQRPPVEGQETLAPVSVGVEPGAAKAFVDLVIESGMPELGVKLNALSWLTGPIILAPYVVEVRGEPRLCLHEMLADRTEVRRSRHAPDVLEAILWERDDGVFVELDAHGWRYWTAEGARWVQLGGQWVAQKKESGAVGENPYIPHGLDYCPAVPLRSTDPLLDWWGATDHQGLIDATLEVAVMWAVGRWVRSQTTVPLTVIVGLIENIPALQALGHPTQPLIFNAPAGQVSVDVKDRSTDPSRYLSEIAALVNATVARYGIPPSEVTFENNGAAWHSLAIAVRGERLGVQRDAQVPWLRRAELALWPVVADVVRASTHRHSEALPPPVIFQAALRIAFPDLATPEERIKRTEAFERGLPHGLSNAVTEMMTATPERPRAELEEENLENLRDHADRIELVAARNVPVDPARGYQSLAQLQGRIGGLTGAARTEDPAPP